MQPALNKRDTGEGLHGAARHSYAHAQYTQPVSISWFNVRQRMVYMNSAEGFAL